MTATRSAILAIVLLFSTATATAGADDARLRPYIDVLRGEGRPPLDFVLDKLDQVDLVVFDDAWHPCAEPWEFYQELVRAPGFRAKAKYVFVEVFPINRQPSIDAYLRSDPEDVTLLYPAFQDDLGGTGWPLQSYFDLLHAIWEVDHPASGALDDDERIRVIAVNAATYWAEMTSAEDVTLFRRSLLGNDDTMYRVIVDELDDFSGAHKGIFLTNTRHAYKGIRDREGRLFWNAGTFLHERHPGKTVSIRFHNMALSIEAEKPRDESTPETTAGMERYTYSWVRMADGLWDSAFEAMGNGPVAFPIVGNAFGAHPYIGNHMHKAAPGQTMADANDAVIFLAPLEALHNTATTDAIYTSAFKRELARRYRLLYTPEQVADMMDRAGAETLEALVDRDCAASPRVLIPQAANLPPKDAWRTGRNSP